MNRQAVTVLVRRAVPPPSVAPKGHFFAPKGQVFAKNALLVEKNALLAQKNALLVQHWGGGTARRTYTVTA